MGASTFTDSRLPLFWWGEAPEEPNVLPRANRANANRSMCKAYKRAEPWPTTDHGSASLLTVTTVFGGLYQVLR